MIFLYWYLATLVFYYAILALATHLSGDTFSSDNEEYKKSSAAIIGLWIIPAVNVVVAFIILISLFTEYGLGTKILNFVLNPFIRK